MAAAPVAALVFASTAVTAYSAIQQGRAASRSARSQAQADELNARNAAESARVERQQALQRELAQRREANRLFGRQRAAIAQSGTGFGGSNLDILEQSSVAAEMDALNIRYEGEMRSRGYTQQAQLDTLSASNSRRNARQYKTAGYLNAGGSILTGAANYSAYKRSLN